MSDDYQEGGLAHQDWTPVVIRNSSAAKKAKQQKQNPPGTSEFIRLNGELPKPNKITPEECKVLIQARNAKGLTQQAFANMMRVDVGTIRSYENGTIANFQRRFYNTMLMKLGVKP